MYSNIRVTRRGKMHTQHIQHVQFSSNRLHVPVDPSKGEGMYYIMLIGVSCRTRKKPFFII